MTQRNTPTPLIQRTPRGVAIARAAASGLASTLTSTAITTTITTTGTRQPGCDRA